MRLRYFSMGKVSTRIWLFILFASFGVPVMQMLFPYLHLGQYYPIASQLQQYSQHLNQTANQTQALGKALAGDQNLVDKFKAFLTLTPIGFAIRMFLMGMKGLVTGLHPVWLMLGLGDLKTRNGTSLADILSAMVYLFYTWTIYNIATGRDE